MPSMSTRQERSRLKKASPGPFLEAEGFPEPAPGPKSLLEGLVCDLAGLALEVSSLERGMAFYKRLFGFPIVHYEEERGVAEFGLPGGQRLSLWKPVSRQPNSPRLAALGARGGSHVHFALQIPRGSRAAARQLLRLSGLACQEIELGPGDCGLYFFDPFGHGLELREVSLDPEDPRAPRVPPGQPGGPEFLPVVGLREVALSFQDFGAMVERLPRAYGFTFAGEMEDRAFAQFVLAPEREKDGDFTPRRWLYAWDPQVGLAEMFGGEHATVQFYADVESVAERAREAGLPCVRDARGLAVRDPEGHVFEFLEPPVQG